MTIDTIRLEIRTFLINSFRIKDIDYSSNIFETGGVHSLFFIQLLVFIEKKFKIELVEGEFEPAKLNSIKAIAELINSKVN